MITLPELCQKHQALLVHQAGYGTHDPWRALIIVSSIALFQGLSADKRIQEKCGGDIAKVCDLGCPACLRPDLFGEVVEAAKGDMANIKALGERWVTEATK